MNRVLHKVLATNSDDISSSQRSTHTHVIGQPGTGKSRALESWIMQDINLGHGVGVIDPHGDLFQNLVTRIALKPEVWNKVIIIDPCDPQWVVSFNPLEAVRGLTHERLSTFLTDVVSRIWSLDTANSPRMVWLLANTFLALSNLRLSLLDLPRFLLDMDYRGGLIDRISNLEARSYFLYEFPKTSGAVHQWVTPVLNKIGGLIFDPDIRLMLAGESGINFRNVMDQGNILLVHLPKGIIGEGPSALLGAFIVAHLQKAALSRADLNKRNSFYLYLDEFQNYTTDNINDILSESRKYALSLILAHQYLDQLSTDLRNAVLNTAGTLACFRVGYQDASRLVRDIFPSQEFLSTSTTSVVINKIGNWPILGLESQSKPLGWEGLAMGLTKLSRREFWVKQRGRRNPVKLRTQDMPDIILTHEVEKMKCELLDYSGSRFGRLKEEVREKQASAKATIYEPKGGRKLVNESDTPDDNYSLWDS
ncbi:MAG: hypothetical protein JW908_05650 [Anaerolineales bacterium]|nr:hypothetical protein [Anaerolineales bacterium]